MPMNWDDLKILLAVARTGSLSRAASRLEMDQSTVGRRLSALEAALDTRLFLRSSSGLALSEAGAALLPHALAVEASVWQFGEHAGGSYDGPRGLVRLISNAWILHRLSDTVLPELIQSYPHIALRLLAHTPRAPVMSDATLSLWFEAPPKNGDTATPIGAVPFALYHHKSAAPDTLDWVSFYDEDAPNRAPLRQMRKLDKADATPRLTASDAELVQALIAQGAGKGFLPRCIGDKNPALIAVDDAAHCFSRVLHLHCHPDMRQAHRVRVLTDALVAAFDALFLPPPQG